MRKLITLAGLVAVAVVLMGMPTLSQQGYTQEQLAAWQAIAETFYEEGIDENFMLGDPTLLDGQWGYTNPRAIAPGMIAPDFTLITFEGEPFTLSDYVGEKFIVLITGSWYWPPYLRNWVANNKIVAKYANDYPVIMVDLYGRERHPEATDNMGFVLESYNDRRQRAELMLWTLQYVEGGVRDVTNRILLIDEDGPESLRTNPTATMTSTWVTHMYGGRPQGGFIIDLNGRIILNQQWERPEQVDEALAQIFGIEPGL